MFEGSSLSGSLFGGKNNCPGMKRDNCAQPPSFNPPKGTGSSLLMASAAPLGPHHKSVEELLDVNTDTTGFENAQKGNDVLLSQWEETLEDVDNYSKKLREMKEMFTCRITQLNSTLKKQN
ncbi:unnamed protein product [Lepeophtheirus salmonis]|uniref:(salmon louse) hypothetical protein n=1 Tax=Lepeophtheirus salmonis TaxID=72036 RepID=A0A7R8HD33_LEPSM|nr:unnamed protein product [Lepeophtheirus salmonis]CAF3026456.1 unnamed protein product [Lepeophtheirus salmonis]